MSYSKKSVAGGDDHYYKTTSDFISCPGNTSLTEHLQNVSNHIVNKSNPHKVTLAQLGYDEASLISKVVDMLYPVNSIKMTWNNVNPGTKIPGTTWVLVSKGRYLRGVNPDSDDTTINKNATGGVSSVAIGTHTHTLSSHTHTGPSHTHTLSSHTHTGPSHTHSIGAHSHLQTFGADDGSWYFMAGNGEWDRGVVGSTWRSVNGFWGGQLSAPGTGSASFHRTQQCSAYTSGAAGTGATGGPSNNSTSAAGTGATGGPSNNTSGAGGSHNVSINPPFQTVYVWRRTA